MDCQTARVLLAFARRPVECLDPGEQLALRQHLDGCPDCAALAHDERRADEAVGAAVREVPVPAGLQGRILARIAAQRRPVPYWLTAAAAALLLAIGVAGYATYAAQPKLTMQAIVDEFENSPKLAKSPETVEEWFAGHGVRMHAPRQFKYEYYRSCDLVQFGDTGQLVPILRFQAREIAADVYVLSRQQFRLDDLAGAQVPSRFISIIAEPPDDPDVVYLVNYSSSETYLRAALLKDFH